MRLPAGGPRRLQAASLVLLLAAQRGSAVPTGLTLNTPVSGAIPGFGGLDKFLLDNSPCAGQCVPACAAACADGRGRRAADAAPGTGATA